MKQELGWTVVGMVTYQRMNDAIVWWNARHRGKGA
jgi:hypothetical protein